MPFLLSYPAIMVAAWFGGLGPGVLATFLSVLIATHLPIEPGGRPLIATFQGGLTLALLAPAGLVSSAICEALLRARHGLGKSEWALQHSEGRFWRLFEADIFGILVADCDGRITEANQAFLRIVGYTNEDLVGGHLRWDELTPPDWHPLDARAVAEARATGVCAPYEKELFRRDGTRVPVLIGAVCLRGEPESGIGICIDLTERKRAEEELRRSRQELADFIEEAVVGLHSVGPDGRILWVNQAELDLLGYAREEYVGHHIAEFHVDQDVIEDILQRLASHESLRDHEARLRRKDGSIRHVLIDSSARWEEGEFVHTRCFTRDITERKRAEEELARLLAREQAARAEAEAAQRRSAFLAESCRVLSSSLDYEATLAHVARLAVPFFADYCIVDLLDGMGQIRRVAAAHARPDKEQLLAEIQRRFPPDWDSPHPSSIVLRTGQPMVNLEVSRASQKAVIGDPDALRLIWDLGPRSLIAMPLEAHGHTLGAICFGLTESGRRYEPKDLALAEELAQRAAGAIDNARLYHEVQQEINERQRAEQELTAAHKRLSQTESEKKRFHREVIRAVTGDRLHLVDVEEVPTEGSLVSDVSLDETDAYPALRKQIQEIAEGAGMLPDAARDLVTAAGEAISNAIKHALDGRCAVYLAPDRVIVRVTDRGPGIRAADIPASVLVPGYSTKISLGLGHTLMLQAAERIWLATGSDGTVVQLEKWIRPEEQPERPLPVAWGQL